MLSRRESKDEQNEKRAHSCGTEDHSEEHMKIQDKPRICTVDINDEYVQFLKSHGFNCYPGTLGPVVTVPNDSSRQEHKCLLGFKIPENLHEYDVVVIDLQNPSEIPYSQSQHTRGRVKGDAQFDFVSRYPETVFDPRAYSAHLLNDRIVDLMAKQKILIVFASESEETTYNIAKTTHRRDEVIGSKKLVTYAFYPGPCPIKQNLKGVDSEVVTQHDTELSRLLKRHNDDASYTISFQHPYVWENRRQVLSEKFQPLMKSQTGDIISYAQLYDKGYIFVFPCIQEKGQFLKHLLDRFLPTVVPGLFPFNTQFSWKKDPAYNLPDEHILAEEMNELREQYRHNLKQIEDKIEANRKKHEYLHDLLTQSGDELVKTVECFLTWLGFNNVINVDETEPDLNEEDLQIETDDGLLVIEVKGIGGTSTDAACSQISKIRYRRAEERQRFDVFGLFIVNHQRYLPPDKRDNPPFNEIQIQDAENDKRGLLTTYELFKLHFNVSEGLITKEDARKALLQTGLVHFEPSDAVKMPPVSEIHHNGSVVIMQIDNLRIRKEMSLIEDKRGRFYGLTIEDIQIDGQSVDEADSGEVGIKLSGSISKQSELWLQTIET